MEGFDSTLQDPVKVLVGWRTGNKVNGGPFGSSHMLLALKTFCGAGVSDEEGEKGEFTCTFSQAVVCAYKVILYLLLY